MQNLDSTFSSSTQTLIQNATEALDDLKAKEVKTLDVRAHTDIAEAFIIASATSKRHVAALADNVLTQVKAAGGNAKREGERDSEWTLVDLGVVVVHIFTPDARKFYDLESLWQAPAGEMTRTLSMMPDEAYGV